MKRIYMDHAATTQTDPEVVKAMEPCFTKKFGNASSLHQFGVEAKEALEESREKIAKLINAKPSEIIFTSCGSESNNLALKGIMYANKKKGNHIITSRIEHHAIIETCKYLEKQGFTVTYLPVDKYGMVDPGAVEKAITNDTVLVSIMHANNEIGTIEPIEEIGKLCREKKVYFHTDAVQTVGKIPVDVKKLNVDLLSSSAHKLYGPKGVGFLYKKEGINLVPLIHGGGHEAGFRSGTENVAGIVGFAKACELAEKRMDKEITHLRKLSKKLVDGVLKIENSYLNGHPEKRLPGTNNFRFDFIEGESLILRLDMKGIAASTGSACSTKSLEPSHVLTAIGLKHVQAHGSLRLSLGKDNTEAQVDYLLGVLPNIVKELRKMSPLAGK
ncbi:cysteine desulfurase NifS [Candidatus Woesearchaeota archaeon]|nr:cysteine desulfurase NifS [Candidatus Woesearchaeota archaeon]